MGVEKETLTFLKQLSKNNNREWFTENKPRYKTALADFKTMVKAIENKMSEFDILDKTKVFRIYRDVRFSKDKTPYKTHLSANFQRLGENRRGGYYLQISPENTFVGGGFWKPESQDMKFIREGIDTNAEVLRKAINNRTLQDKFGGMHGDELKTSPRGYSTDHPEIDLLRKKQFLLMREYDVEDILQDDFADKVSDDFKAMVPMFEAITEYLLFDGNGVRR